MPKSPAYIRIKENVLKITQAIPKGRVATFKAVGDHLEVMPRHVAYLMATLKEEERLEIPWWRLVSETGEVRKTPLPGMLETQAELLDSEGVSVDTKRKVINFPKIVYTITEKSTGVPQQYRPADAPITRGKKR